MGKMTAISLMHPICKLCFSRFAWYFCGPEGTERNQRSAAKEIRQEKKTVGHQRHLLKHNSEVQSCGKQLLSPYPKKDLLLRLGKGTSNDTGLSKALPSIKADARFMCFGLVWGKHRDCCFVRGNTDRIGTQRSLLCGSVPKDDI